MEDIVIILGLKVLSSDNSYMFSCSRNTHVSFVEKLQLKIISFKKYKQWYKIHTWLDKAIEGTVENWAQTSLNGGLIELRLQSQ